MFFVVFLVINNSNYFESTFAVASSISIIFDFFRMALAKHSN